MRSKRVCGAALALCLCLSGCSGGGQAALPPPEPMGDSPFGVDSNINMIVSY